jgi:hypothetical protein
VNLVALKVMVYLDATLEPIAALTRLEDLDIVHLPRVSDLSPLPSLTSLRRLSLATLPSWDASGKVTEVRSLAPLADLPLLADLSLFGVRTPDKSVDDLLRIRSLRTVRISKYPREAIDRLNAAVAART